MARDQAVQVQVRVRVVRDRAEQAPVVLAQEVQVQGELEERVQAVLDQGERVQAVRDQEVPVPVQEDRVAAAAAELHRLHQPFRY